MVIQNDINPTINVNAQRYFTNARGVNYVPPMRTEWASTGGIPRLPPGIFPLLTALGTGAPATTVSYEPSSTFGGSNKTAMWWYYDSADNDYYLGILKSVGMNCVRVFLDFYVWESKGSDHLDDICDFLRLCDKHKIRCQFVTWDGIQIGADQPAATFDLIGLIIKEPSSTGSLDSVPHGLGASWHRVPHAFEYSSTLQAQDFFDNRATPYLDAIIDVVRPYQSMWSFDVQNELDNVTARVFTSATASHLSQGLSANGVTVTVGNGAGFDPGLAALYDDSGGASGSKNLFYNPNMMSVLDFASFHTYGNSKFSLIKYVNQGISGSIDTGMPAMYNESSNYDTLSYPGNELGYMYGAKDFGGMIFDGFIENSLSREPFLSVQGLFYADGTVKSSRDLSAYSFYASGENWFSPNQLTSVFDQKATSVDEGADGGFFSGIVATVKTYDGTDLTASYSPNHITYSDSYSGITEDDWIKNRHAVYLLKGTAAPLIGGKNPNGSVTYPPQVGSDMEPNLFYSLAASGVSMEGLVENLFTMSSLSPLSSFGDTIYDRNNQLMYMNQTLKMIMFSTFDSSIHDAVRKTLTATQWDYNIACTPTSRQELELAWSALTTLRATANSIAPYIDNRQLESAFDLSSMICHESSLCFYAGGGGVAGANYPGASITSDDIDWAAYDTYYQTLIAKMANCVQQHINYAATTDQDYGLY